MPPKKKKGKKSGKKKSERKSAKGSDGASETLSELSKEFYLIQIRDLETRLNRYQKKCDELEIGSGKLKSGFDQQASDKKEIVSFLKKQLEQRSDEIADLQERMIGLQQAKDTEKDQFDQQISSLRTEMQEVKDQLTSENMVLGGKLTSLEEFRVQREGLMAKFARMEETLQSQERQHKDTIYQLEKKSVIDKDRLKKDMIIRVNNVASEFRKVSNKQIADTTKRTLRENVAINSQLAKMSDKTMELIKESDELKETEKETKLQLQMLEHNENELVTKNASNLQLIRLLTDKAKEQQAAIKSYQSHEHEMNHLKRTMVELQRNQTEDESKITTMETRIRELSEQNTMMTQTKDSVEQKNTQLVAALARTVSTLKMSLKATDTSCSKEDKNNARMSVLQTLIEVLDTAADEQVSFAAKELFSSDISNAKQQAPAMWHYNIGDLGMIPPPMASMGRRQTQTINKPTRGVGKGSSAAEKLKLPMLS